MEIRSHESRDRGREKACQSGERRNSELPINIDCRGGRNPQRHIPIRERGPGVVLSGAKLSLRRSEETISEGFSNISHGFKL